MKKQTIVIEDGGWQARSLLACGGNRSVTPLSCAAGFTHLTKPSSTQKLPRRRAVPEQSTIRWLALLLGFILLPASFCLRTFGQSYSVDWYKVAGGGGTSTGGTYQVTGTIGQHDAGGTMAGGSYSLTGGFWALISVVQTAGLPDLIITHSGNSVTVSWPNTGSYTLQQNNNLAVSGGWATSGYTITTASGTNSVTVTPPPGNLFFRLKQ